MTVFTKAFWTDAAERALTTVAQTFVALTLTGGVFDLAVLDWPAITVSALSAGVLSLGKSLAAANMGVKGTASLTSATLPNPTLQKGIR